MSDSGSGGGSATAGGMEFQHRVAAWLAVAILAEKGAALPWDLGSATFLEALRCESGMSVDDILVRSSQSGLLFLNAKRNLSLSRRPDSEFASAVGQFVNQFLAGKNRTSQIPGFDRPLEQGRDRLILAVGPGSSAPVKTHLRNILDRLRRPAPGVTLTTAHNNDDERNALETIVELIRTAWQGSTNEEILELLRLLYVQEFAVEAGGAQELQARTLFRTVILQEPDQADAAWSLLSNECSRMAANRSGTDRAALQHVLDQSELPQKATFSYRPDIVRLQQLSKQTLADLNTFSEITVQNKTIKIVRDCRGAFSSAALDRSVLVVGEPGAGKSGATHDFVQSLEDDQEQFIFLAVDRLASESLGELRQELGLEHDLFDIIDHWPGTAPVYLVIDALDAARAEPKMRLYRDIIRRGMARNANCRVVASIRKFDLRNSKELQQFFSGDPVDSFPDSEFPRIAHLNIRQLSDEELGQIAAQSSELHQLVQAASPELLKLIRTVFNLRLLAELLDSGASASELTPIRTQIELLEKYWSYRVICEDGNGFARERLLAEIAQIMVEGRRLRVTVCQLSAPIDSRSLDELLRNHVLIQWQSTPAVTPDRNRVVFAHNILFDYVVARLLLSDESERLLDYLAGDPDLFLIIRPSISLHLQHLWINEPIHHDTFWRETLLLSHDPRIPDIGKLIAPSVVVDLASGLDDFEQLLEVLTGADADQRRSAETTFAHIVGSIFSRPNKELLAGSEAGPWSDLTENVSRGLNNTNVFPLTGLIQAACEHFADFTAEQRDKFGLAARRVLGFAWDQPLPHEWLVIQGIKAVSRTFASDPSASAILLRRAIEVEHLAHYGYRELSWIGHEIKNILPHDPQLVADIYAAAFRFQESSQETTTMGNSRILPLTSNRRQDYKMGLFQLSQVFPQFLRQAPDHALETLIAVLETYPQSERRAGDQPIETFDFNGQEAQTQSDRSSMWDRSNHRHDEQLKILDAFIQYMKDLAGTDHTQESLKTIIDKIVRDNKSAVLWRRLLLLGAEFPDSLGMLLIPLVRALPILKGYDTSREAGEFLKKVFPGLVTHERELIEQAILSIPQTVSADRQGVAEDVRNRLLGCLTLSVLVTQDARSLLSELQAADQVPVNKISEGIQVTSRAYLEEDFLRDQGVPVNDEPNRQMRKLEAPVKEFIEKFRNEVPDSQEAHSIVPAVLRLHDALLRTDADGVHPEQSKYARNRLGEVCSIIARIDDIDCREETGWVVKEILLELSVHPEPIHNPESDEHFNEFPSWSPTPRIEAALGLLLLAAKESCADETLLGAVDRLSRDNVAAVRHQIAEHLRYLFTTANGLMWDTVGRLARTEQNYGVLQFFLPETLSPLYHADMEKVIELTLEIYNRVTDGPGSRNVRNGCLDIFTELCLRRNNERCSELVKALAVQVDQFDDIQTILGHFRAASTFGLDALDDLGKKSIRDRCYGLVESILDSLLLRYAELETLSQRPDTDWTEEDKRQAQNIMQLIDHIASDVYFSSGAYSEKQDGTDSITPDKKAQQFYEESSTLLNRLSTVSMPNVTHHLVETLQFFIPLDPRGVLLRIGQVLGSGRRGGYQFESLGAQLLVKIVERYLAEYGDLLQNDPECRHVLMNALNIFVAWPEARQLTYRLDDIFR
jgi:hypothetical protein